MGTPQDIWIGVLLLQACLLTVRGQDCPWPCATCSTSNECTACGPGSYLSVYSSCEACPLNCERCDASGCLANGCYGGFYNSGSDCQLCPPNCVSCTASGCSAGGCYSGFYNSGTGCQRCSERCFNCTSANTCSSCNSGYYLSNGICTECVIGCDSCSNGNLCTPEGCQNGLTYNPTTQLCDGCPETCLSCSDTMPNACTSCTWGTYLTARNTCEKCPYGCSACTNQTYCTSCYAWFYLSADNTCKACSQGCNSCVSASMCFVCDFGYYFNNNTCTVCPPNCYWCDASGCADGACTWGYYNSGTDCQRCTLIGCDMCLTSNTCTSTGCRGGFAYNPTTQRCDVCTAHCDGCLYGGTCLPNGCRAGYTFDTATKTCLACAAHCNYCFETNTCEPGGCAIGYSYDPVSQACFVCTPQCEECITPGTCIPEACASGTAYNSTTNTCDACSPGCSRCPTPGTCYANGCYQGYIYDSTSQTCMFSRFAACSTGCVQCASPSTCLPNGCSGGFMYDAVSQTCKHCAPDCFECTTPRTCLPTGCYSGTVYDTESKACLACAPNCGACSSPGTCNPNGCYRGYTYVFDSPSLSCVACEVDKPCMSAMCGFGSVYNVTTQVCVACPVGCNYCESDGTCLSTGGCSWSYAFNVTSGRCERCSDNCNHCSEPGTCVPNQCNIYSSTSVAFNSASRRCEECSPYCNYCYTPGTCYSCDSGYTLNTATQQCDACPPHCLGCDTPGTCYSCRTGYVLNYTTMQCEACALNCYRCTQPNTCTDTGCSYNYIYDRVNKTCKMDSPCNQNVMQCNNRGTCQPTDNYPYYLCTCNTGYMGSQCEQKIASRLYPHGYSTGDRVLLNTDDGSTPRIVFGQPFLFYGRFLSSAFVNMNGFISFSKNYPVYRPMPFPHQNSEEADLLAPFWADSDSSCFFYYLGPSNLTCINCDCGPGCPTCGTNVVYYQIHSRTGNSINATLTAAVLDQATADGKNYINGFGSADWVLVVTWSQVIPFRYSSNRYSYERNTFQAVLAMNTANLKSFVTFRYDEIRWNNIRPAIMGIQAAASNYYYNYPSADVYQLADLIGEGSSEVGVSVFDTSGTVTPSAKGRCMQWVARERGRQTEVRSYVDQLPPCPCSGFQALFTPAYRWITGTDCFVSVDKSIVNAKGKIVGMKCCYDRNVWMWSFHWAQWGWMWTWVWMGDLVSSPVAEAGGFYDNNPLYYSPALIAEDSAKTDCCVNSANCPTYFSVRPIKTCDGYVAPRLSWIFGDPHITTLDGLAYDYNGIGEYWLIKSPVLQVQARTSQATDGVSGAPVNASIFTAFAIQVPEAVGQDMSDRVVVLMTSSTQLELYVIPKTQPDTARVNLTDWMTNTTAQPTPDTLNTYPGFVLSRLAEGTGVIVNIDSGPLTLILRLEAGQLSMTSVPGANLVGKTGGLLGTYDNNTANDLTLANGTVLPADSSPQNIYYTFGESWRTTSSESLMYYSDGDSHAAHQQPSFVPMFTATFTSQTSEQTARDLCGDDSNCLLDYAATNNAQLALTSANNTQTGKSTNQLFSSSQPVVQGPSVWHVTVGQAFTATYTTTNADGSSVILRASGLPDGASLNRATGVVTWTPALTEPVFNVSINTVSDRGVPALNVLVTVYLCDGCSSHGQCEFDMASPTNLSYRFEQVTCLCADGYTGNSCELATDPCANDPCGVGATCEPVPAGHVNIYNLTYNCTVCAPGFIHDLGKCVNSDVADLDSRNNQSACSSQPCQNNGACQGTQTAYTCTCSEEYSGMLCETRIVTTTTLTTATPVTTTKLTTTTTPVTTTKRTTTTTLPPQKTALTKKTTLPSQTVKSSTVSTVAKTASARPKVTRTSAVTVTTGVPKSAATSLAQTVWVVTAALSTGLLLIG